MRRLIIIATALGPVASAATADQAPADLTARLLKGYPGIVTDVTANSVVFHDGARLPLDDGKGTKTTAERLASPDIEDMFHEQYPVATIPLAAPARDFDPGRIRNIAFFTKIYGDCRASGVAKHLVEITWLPKKSGAHIKVTRINGVAERLAAVSAELDQLPGRFDRYLFPIAGTYSCRVVAGTDALSAHAFGIAIDLNPQHTHYWRWADAAPNGSAIAHRNTVPMEIVSIFEKHGFIWGGRWYHYDTMHFEYRPELLP